jgi:hypothetical protein
MRGNFHQSRLTATEAASKLPLADLHAVMAKERRRSGLLWSSAKPVLEKRRGLEGTRGLGERRQGRALSTGSALRQIE